MTKKPGRPGDQTRAQILDAALETLKREGFAGATSRAIARAGGFNQALVFYHFGSLNALLLAALDRTSEERLRRYREAVHEADTFQELVALVVRAHAEDREGGHATVVAQMIAGSVARPELAPGLVARLEPWLELCEQALAKAFDRLGIVPPAPLPDLAYAVVTFYLGVNLLTHLDESRRVDALFGRLEELAPVLARVFGA